MRPFLVIAGATATGKSRLALRLAERLGGEIVNADALQVYRGFDIGTAKPTPAERRRVRHHLIDILEPHEPFSAGEFVRRAKPLLQRLTAAGRLPIVVGGSGFYQRALLGGLHEVPPTPPELRRGLASRLARGGLAPLRRQLEVLDPETAGRLAPGDTQRTLRALEVAFGTGRRLSEWLRGPATVGPPLAWVRVALTLPRSVLYDRIAERVVQMARDGWVEEVEGLLAQGLSPGLPAFQAIGYRQIVRHVRGECSLEQALEETVRSTRRFARRQETWLRSESDVQWIRAGDESPRVAAILALLREAGWSDD